MRNASGIGTHRHSFDLMALLRRYFLREWLLLAHSFINSFFPPVYEIKLNFSNFCSFEKKNSTKDSSGQYLPSVTYTHQKHCRH